ncbi:MAG: tetratricopeptide repeat protein [Chitinophagales bacterium]
MKKTANLSLVLLIFLSACTGPDRSSSLEKVKEAESMLFDKNESFKFDEALAQSTIDAYGDFAENFPKDSLTPNILFKKADLHRAMKDYEVAMDIYKKIENDYSDHNKAPHSLFLQGFVYENEIGDMEKAAERYQAFLEKYPNHDLSDDVKFSLDNLGKSPEDIIKEFNKKQNAAAIQDSVL